MPKLIFRVNADTSPVKKFRAEIEQIEKAMIRIKGENFSFDHWIKEFDRLKTELERKRAQIDDIKKNILTVHPVWEKKKFDSLNTELSKSSKERDALINDTISLSNKFGKAYDDLVATLGKAQKVTDEVTSRFIQQKQVVANLQSEVRSLNAEYRNANKGDKVGIRSQITSKQKELEQQRVTLNALKAEQERAKLAVKGLSDETRNYEKVVGKVSGAQAEANLVFSRFERSLLRIGGLATLQRLASDVVRVRGEFQQLEIAFETMLKSKDKASALMGQLIETAAKTPFDLQGIAQGAKQLLAYGTSAEDVNDTLVRLGNIASGLSIPLNDLVWLYGTTQTQGRLFTQDVRQFMGRGIPLVKELAKELGKTEQQINEMVTAGKIGFPEVEKVIRNMTNEGGQFYNLMEKQSASLTGQISNLGDAWDMMLNKIGAQTQGIASAGISTVTSLIENYEEVGVVLASLIASYGTYKAAIIIVNTLEKVNIMLLRQAVVEKKLAAAANITLSNSMAVAAARGKMFALMQKSIVSSLKGIGKTLANPYVWFGAAVGAATYGLYKFYTRETEVERMQRRYNETKEAAARREEEHKSKVDELISSLESETTAQMERVGAIETLKQLYPGIIEKYIDEEGHLKNLIALNKELAEFDATKKVEQNKTDLRSYDERIKDQEEYINQMRTNDQAAFDDEVAKLNELKRQREIVRKAVATDYINWSIGNAKSMTDEELRNTINIYQKALSENKDGEWFDSNQEFNVDEINKYISALKDLQTARANVVKNKEYWEKLKKDTQAQLEALSDVEAAGKKGLALKQKIAEYDKKINAFSTNTTKQENQAEKLRQQQEKYNLLVDKQELERIRKAEDLENQLAQTTIDAMSDGFEKEQAQRELNNKKEIQALKRQKQDYVRAYIQAEREKFNANPANKGKTFNPSSVKVDASKWDAIIENTKTNQGLNEWEKREEAMNEYLLKYGTFSQRKEAIDKKYRAAIDKEVDLGKKNGLQKEWDEALTNLDLSKLKQEINWEMIFGDLSKVTREQLRNIKKQLEAFKNSSEFQKATPEQIEVIESAFNSINNALVDKGGFFGGMVDSVTELKLATEELKKAEEELAEANKKGTEAQKEEAQKKVNAAKKKKQNAEVNVTKSSDKTIQHLTAVGDAIAQLGSSAEMSLSSFGNAAGSIVDAFSEAGSKIGGIVGAIFSILDGIQQQGFDKFVGNILESVAGAALSAATLGWVKIGADYSHYNEMVAQYETLNSIWDELIDKKQKYIDISYGIEASKAGKEAASIQRKAIENYRTLGIERLNSGASAGSHSIGRRIWRDMSNEGWTQAQRALGSDWKDGYRDKSRMTWLFDLSTKQLETLKEEAPTFWAKLDGDVRDYLDNIIKGEEKIQEIQNQVKEQLTQTSFDNVFDSFLDTLMDMDSAAEDFSKDFEEYMKRAVLTNMLGSEYEKQLQDWYDNFAKAMDEKRERGKFLRPGKVIEEAGVLTEEEQAELQKQWDAIVSGALDRRNQLASAMGWESESSEDGRKAAQKGIATASQDSIDELRGTMTNVQGHTYNINENTARIATGINTLTEHTKHLTCLADIDNTMQSLLTMRKESIEHLSNIAEYTSNLVEMKEFMRSMKAGIDTLNTKGLTLKR